MLTLFYDHGHLASLHLIHRFLELFSAKQLWSLPLCWRCLCLLSSLNPQHCSFWSRVIASSLYVRMVYLGCWTKCTFFHHSFKAWRKKYWRAWAYIALSTSKKSFENIKVKQFLKRLMMFQRQHAGSTKASKWYFYILDRL